MEEFNPRELAIGIWIGVALLLTLYFPKIRASIGGVLKSLIHRALLAPIFFLMLWSSIVVWLLHGIGFWGTSFIKDSIIWFLFTGLTLAYYGVESEGAPGYVADMFTAGVSSLFFVEYIVWTYTFSLVVELALVPALLLLGALLGVASSYERFMLVERLLEFVLAVVGLAILTFAISEGIRDMENLISMTSFRTIAFPVVLTTALIPAVVIVVLHVTYEQLFLRLRLNEPRRVVLWAGWQLIKRIGLRPSDVYKFRQKHLRDIVVLRERADVVRFLEKLDSVG